MAKNEEKNCSMFNLPKKTHFSDDSGYVPDPSLEVIIPKFLSPPLFKNWQKTFHFQGNDRRGKMAQIMNSLLSCSLYNIVLETVL